MGTESTPSYVICVIMGVTKSKLRSKRMTVLMEDLEEEDDAEDDAEASATGSASWIFWTSQAADPK